MLRKNQLINLTSKDVEHYPIIKPEFEGHQDVEYSEEPESNEDDIDEEHPQLNPITDELDNDQDTVEKQLCLSVEMR